MRRLGKTHLQRIEHVGLIGFDLEQIVATFGLQQFHQRPLGVDGIAGEKLQSWIGRQQFGKMIFETSRFVGFVAAD